jgi:hypothetical protein
MRHSCEKRDSQRAVTEWDLSDRLRNGIESYGGAGLSGEQLGRGKWRVSGVLAMLGVNWIYAA